MRNALRLSAIWILATLVGGVSWAADFKLLDQSTISGEVSDGNDYGVIFRITGGFSKRISYSKFTQEALKELASIDRLKPMVEPFLDLPAPPRPKPKSVMVREVPRVTRPGGRTTLFSSFLTPLGLGVFGILYLANLFVAYEIARYRNRPVAVVCGLAALLPLLGPLIFLVSPTIEAEGEEGGPVAEPEPAEAEPAPGVPLAGSAAGATSRRVGMAPAASSLKVAASRAKSKASAAEPRVFNRGEYTFNRRFVETQFSGFFRVVPSEAEKDLVLVVRTAKQEYIGKRITRITANEFFLQLLQGGGKEVNISFGEISQITVTPKDDKD